MAAKERVLKECEAELHLSRLEMQKRYRLRLS